MVKSKLGIGLARTEEMQVLQSCLNGFPFLRDGETNYLQAERPQVVKEFVKVLERSVANGHSTEGFKLKNDVDEIDIMKRGR